MAQRGAAARSTDRFERKREAILDAATRILNRKGVKGLTLSDAASAVDLSTTSVTYYFKRKDDLAAAVITRGIEAYIDMAERACQERALKAFKLDPEQWGVNVQVRGSRLVASACTTLFFSSGIACVSGTDRVVVMF